MADQTCPACGNDLPSELAQHADNLEIGLVTCPSCGAGVTIAKGPNDTVSTQFERAEAAPPGRTEGQEAFSGNETLADLKDELENKPQ